MYLFELDKSVPPVPKDASRQKGDRASRIRPEPGTAGEGPLLRQTQDDRLGGGYSAAASDRVPAASAIEVRDGVSVPIVNVRESALTGTRPVLAR